MLNFSVKMIGLFVTALVGVYTIEDLWDKFGDTKMTWVSVQYYMFIHKLYSKFSPSVNKRSTGELASPV